MAKLVLFLPDGTTIDVPLERERTTLGRRSDNDICLPNLAVSGEHAVVVTILGDSFLEDLKSTNGKLLIGARAGTAVALTKSETTVGRPGVQVASIIQSDGRHRLKLLEGISPPTLNGQPVGADGAELSPGDTIEVAGTRLEFIVIES